MLDRQLWHDEAAHKYGGGDANGNAAFKPRLPLNLASCGLAHSGYPKIVFSNLGNLALMSA